MATVGASSSCLSLTPTLTRALALALALTLALTLLAYHPAPTPRPGTVNQRSLRVCEAWGATQPQPVRVQIFDGIDHQGMIKDARVIRLVLNASRM